jgi:hypothetical protein
MRRRLSFDWLSDVECCGQLTDIDQHLEWYGTGRLSRKYEQALEIFYGTKNKDEMIRRSQMRHDKAVVWCNNCSQAEIVDKDTGECLKNCKPRRGSRNR